jgi:hypothetical protein
MSASRPHLRDHLPPAKVIFTRNTFWPPPTMRLENTSMKLRQGLVSLLWEHGCGDTFILTAVMFKNCPGVVEPGRPNLVTRAQLTSVHRALAGLAKQGLIVRLGPLIRNGRTHWCTPEYAAEHPELKGGHSDRTLADKSRVAPEQVYTKLGVSASTFYRHRLRTGQ